MYSQKLATALAVICVAGGSACAASRAVPVARAFAAENVSRSDSGKLSATEARRRLTTSTISTLPNAFVPYIITVAVGDSVTFAFGGDIDHNVIWRASNPSGAPANIENATNETFVRRLTTRGTFNYECTVHPGMIGQIVVR